jgi:hypothetical protein
MDSKAQKVVLTGSLLPMLIALVLVAETALA